MSKLHLEIGNIDNLILFGGGLLLIRFAKESIRRGIKTHVFAAQRHLNEVVKGDNGKVLTLRQILKKDNIPFFHVTDINSSPELHSLLSDNTMGIGLGEVYTFTQETISLFKGKLFDFMTIKLPKYRGGAHFSWQILRNDKSGAWHIQEINEEMIPGIFDSGAILKSREYLITPELRSPKDFYRISDDEGLKLFMEFLDEIKMNKSFSLTYPDESLSLYLPRLYTLKHGFINWSWEVNEIDRFVLAFGDPYPGASTFLNGERIFLKNCKVNLNDGEFHPFMSGLIYRVYKGSIFIAAKDGSLIIWEAFDEDGNDIAMNLKVGQRFYTPLKYLETAMLYSAEYDSEGLIVKSEKGRSRCPELIQ